MAIPQIRDWRERILISVGARPTSENLRFMDAWARAEGGTAANNPFNTTQNMPGASAYNSVGVRNFVSPQQGIDATVNTLTNGRYGNIIGALKQGDNALAAAQALSASPWGTGELVTKILGGPAQTTPQAPAASSPSAAAVSTTQPSGAAPTSMAGDGTAAPTRQLGFRSTYELASQMAPSPNAVRLMSRLGPLSARAAQASAEAPSRYDDWETQEPVPRTLGTLQTGSTESKFKTVDLTQDFDGPVHPNAQPIVGMAMQYLGTPYLWGGADPRKGFDCSGFVQYLYAQAGISLPRTTYEQVKVGQPIRKMEDLQAGDIVLFSDKGDVHHEGLYIGGGQFIHAPRTGDVVKISNLSEPYYKSQFHVGRRVIGNPQPPSGT